MTRTEQDIETEVVRARLLSRTPEARRQPHARGHERGWRNGWNGRSLDYPGRFAGEPAGSARADRPLV